MKWLEIIELQASNYSRQELERYLRRLWHDLRKDSNRPKFKIYENMEVDSDLSIHIFHSTKMPDSKQSPLSYQIASVLRSFGLVRRTAWTERKAHTDQHNISQENE